MGILPHTTTLEQSMLHHEARREQRRDAVAVRRLRLKNTYTKHSLVAAATTTRKTTLWHIAHGCGDEGEGEVEEHLYQAQPSSTAVIAAFTAAVSGCDGG